MAEELNPIVRLAMERAGTELREHGTAAPLVYIEAVVVPVALPVLLTIDLPVAAGAEERTAVVGWLKRLCVTAEAKTVTVVMPVRPTGAPEPATVIPEVLVYHETRDTGTQAFRARGLLSSLGTWHRGCYVGRFEPVEVEAGDFVGLLR